MTRLRTETLPRTEGLRRDEMKEPDEVSAMLRLKALGWGVASDRGGARVLADDGQAVVEGRAGGRRPHALGSTGIGRARGVDRGAFRRHRGQRRRGPPGAGGREGHRVSLRTVEREVAPLRQELRAEARGTVRLDRPGQQLQVDFGQRRVEVDGAARLVSLFVATSATRAGYISAASLASARSTGSRGWRAPSQPSAAWRRRCCSTAPRR